MTIHHTAIRAIALALCTFAPACDDPDNVDFRYIPPPASGYWTDGDDFCEGFYMKTERGSMCLPPCGSDQCQIPQVDGCGHQVGFAPTCLSEGYCSYICWSDSQCLSGQHCDMTGQCVWENQPVPLMPVVAHGEWGSCSLQDLATCPEGQCSFSSVGSFCSPTCADDSDCSPPLKNECSEKAPAHCVAGRCEIACDSANACWGVDGLVCDNGLCVWSAL